MTLRSRLGYRFGRPLATRRLGSRSRCRAGVRKGYDHYTYDDGPEIAATAGDSHSTDIRPKFDRALAFARRRRTGIAPRELHSTGNYPQTVKHQRADAALQEAVARLRDRMNDPSLGDPLVSAGDALNTLYELEEYHVGRLTRASYYPQRDASSDGQALAGLMYARGLVTHRQAEIAHLITVRAGVTRARRPGEPAIYTGGMAMEYTWKRLSELPPPGKPETHGRDHLYGQTVEGRRLQLPFEAASKFLELLV